MHPPTGNDKKRLWKWCGECVGALATGGVTELAYRPGGPEPERELRAFAAALQLSAPPG